MALDAFIRIDAEAALRIHLFDEKIELEYEALIRQLMTYMMEDPRSVSQIMSIIGSAGVLERIGDRSQNTCEYINYFVSGKVIRHMTLAEIQKL